MVDDPKVCQLNVVSMTSSSALLILVRWKTCIYEIKNIERASMSSVYAKSTRKEINVKMYDDNDTNNTTSVNCYSQHESTYNGVCIR